MVFEAFDAESIAAGVGIFILILFVARGIRVVRPTERMAVERLGKFERIKDKGITWIIPFIHKSIFVNITEQMTDVESQEIITKDNLNARVAAQVYYKVREDDPSVKSALYKVNDYRAQIIALARTTMRNVIGDRDFSNVNSKRGELNAEIMSQIQKQITEWGLDVVRVEVKEIDPPKEVQETMNAVIQANNKKVAANRSGSSFGNTSRWRTTGRHQASRRFKAISNT